MLATHPESSGPQRVRCAQFRNASATSPIWDFQELCALQRQQDILTLQCLLRADSVSAVMKMYNSDHLQDSTGAGRLTLGNVSLKRLRFPPTQSMFFTEEKPSEEIGDRNFGVCRVLKASPLPDCALKNTQSVKGPFGNRSVYVPICAFCRKEV